MKYQAKRPIVEAFRYCTDGPTPVPEWFCKLQEEGLAYFDGPGALRPIIIERQGGIIDFVVNPGDWVTIDPQSKLYVLSDEAFNSAYEPAEQDEYAKNVEERAAAAKKAIVHGP